MENLSEKWRNAITEAVIEYAGEIGYAVDVGTKCLATPRLIEIAEKKYNKPEFNPLCEKIWEYTKSATYMTKKELKEATKDIVEFPEDTDKMSFDATMQYSSGEAFYDIIRNLRENCKQGKYDE